MNQLRINIERVEKHFSELAQINSGTKGYTRAAYSKEEVAAKKWLIDRLQELNAKVSMDEAQNVIARIGSEEGPALAMGSHLDTVIEGGLYDGALGVIAGLEIFQTLLETNSDLPIPLELICFTGEEANPLGGTFGSRAIAGQLQRTSDYDTLLKECGFNPETILLAKREKQTFLGFLELHIEQGEVLETNEQAIGIVTSIAGMIRFQVKILGRASHSGTTPMNLRNDALVQAAKLIQAVDEIAKKYGENIVATVGEISIFPNMANVVPGEAELLVEVRGSELEEMRAAKEEIYQWINGTISHSEITMIVEKKPNKMSDKMQMHIEEASKTLGHSYRHMLSGANHDANSMSTLTETGMIFVPSFKGISHHPEEFTSWKEIEKGINVLLHSVIDFIEKR